jgi:hypothetical protein
MTRRCSQISGKPEEYGTPLIDKPAGKMSIWNVP